MRLPFGRSHRVLIVVYSRAGCSLCQDAERQLKRRVGRANVKVIDISSDAELAAQYSLRVPVVTIAGRVIAEGEVTSADVEFTANELVVQSSFALPQRCQESLEVASAPREPSLRVRGGRDRRGPSPGDCG
jgi:glutaredoxin